MAEYSVPTGHVGVHEKKMTADQVDIVQFNFALREVEILTDGAADIYVMTGAESNPTVQGTDCWRVPPYAGSVTIQVRDWSQKTTVKLISAGTPTYSVAGT